MSQSLGDSPLSTVSTTDPIPAGPVRSKVFSVKPEWIDYNGHLNVAWYEVLFGLGIGALFKVIGLGENYRATRNKSLFAVEAHLSYVREIGPKDTVVVDSQILDHDLKRLRLFQTLIHAEEGYIVATREMMQLHIDMETRKTASFPDDILARIVACAEAHAKLPLPKQAGRSIAIPRG
jgi:acyl-CoA thioester hydrolase